ncbi:MAG: acetolactate decarboxylase, partial [Phyllobacteriaceae bacterium]|nr:acetolactate decarboxylase [Phyllobacteriaceae bacterium]
SAVVVALALSGPAVAQPAAPKTDPAAAESPVGRYSLMGAIKNGYLDANLTVAQLRAKGDFGLGGFAGFSGELVLLDGVVYKITSDGVPHVAAPDEAITYSEFTNFSPSIVVESAGETKSALSKRLQARLGNPNLIYSLRIDGHFRRIRYRDVKEQTFPYPKPICAKNIDVVYDASDVDGTILGFLNPSFVKGGIDYPGSHLHFLRADRAAGGHVYDFEIDHAQISIGRHHVFVVNLPDGERFAHTNVDDDFPCPPQN